MIINSNEIEALISSSGEKRYTYFVKRVVDSEKVWGLYNDGWAMASTDEGVMIFLVWPAKEYAALCTQSRWEDFEPREILLEDFLTEVLPKLKIDGVLPGIFCTPNNNGVTPSTDRLLEDIRSELEKYEY